MPTLTELKQTFGTLVKSISGNADIDKDAVITLINICLNGHKRFITSISKLSSKDKVAMNERLFTLLQNDNSPSGAAWNKYLKGINSQARATETKDMFGSLIVAHKALQTYLNEVKKSVDVLFGTEDTFSPLSMRKSHLAVFGMVMTSMQLTKWSTYMFVYLTAVIDGTDSSCIPYRGMYLSSNVDQVVATVNKLSSSPGSFMKEIEILRAKAEDGVLISDGVANPKAIIETTAMIGFAKLTIGFVVFALSAVILLLKIISWLTEKIDLLAHEAYLLDKETKEWLESRIAKLRMDLEGIDPNDPKYQRISKAIDVYDEKVRDLDRKIDAYLNS